ncbi:MAG TPA: aminoglycoside phosphotransferase family protein [Pyrinomonadaceae bacterium]|nr:aminoglycoside phosphotransferase family protein [Pyrinomonadaceae bacterium]
MSDSETSERLLRFACEWAVSIEESFETESSLIAFGKRADQPIVLKVVKVADEWHSGEVLNAFAENGVVRVYEHAPGALLLERLSPASSLAELSLNDDGQATDILADVIARMSAAAFDRAKVPHCSTVEDWGKGFDRYLAANHQQLPKQLVAEAQSVFARLCASQRRPRLLHGDLQHFNVVFDSTRGWLAIDPKGVIGEVEYEIGAILRNPSAEYFTDATIERRVKQFTTKLNLDRERTLAWGFAQAVLSAIWLIEDGYEAHQMNVTLQLAAVLRSMTSY